jgi:hypothetical protein
MCPVGLFKHALWVFSNACPLGLFKCTAWYSYPVVVGPGGILQVAVGPGGTLQVAVGPGGVLQVVVGPGGILQVAVGPGGILVLIAVQAGAAEVRVQVAALNSWITRSAEVTPQSPTPANWTRPFPFSPPPYGVGALSLPIYVN